MAWLRQNASWVAALLSLIGASGTAYLALYVRAALAEPTTRIAVLEANRVNDAEAIREIKRKVDDIHHYLLGGR